MELSELADRLKFDIDTLVAVFGEDVPESRTFTVSHDFSLGEMRHILRCIETVAGIERLLAICQINGDCFRRLEIYPPDEISDSVSIAWNYNESGHGTDLYSAVRAAVEACEKGGE